MAARLAPVRMTAALEPILLYRAFAVSLALLTVYWLTASGSFHSIDEHAVFATGRNLALHGEMNESSLFWGTPYTAQAMVGLDGELHSKYGPGHSLLIAAVVLAGRAIPGAGLASSSAMLNAVATALTAFLLILTAARLGFSGRASLALGFTYGLATFAWVYARTMFSEPLVALCWMTAIWLITGEMRVGGAFLAGAAFAAGVCIRPATILVAPAFALLVASRPATDRGRNLVLFSVPIVVLVVALLGFNWHRFGDPFEFGYTEGFDGSMLAGLVGFLMSADRSLFLFAPPLVALLWSAPEFLRRHRAIGTGLLAVALVNLVLYSLWPVFWGGPVWGPRYLLPALPLLVLMLAPATERAIARGDWPRWLMIGLALAGVAMQIPGVLWNSLPMTQQLGQRYPLWSLQPKAAWLDLAWVRSRWEPIFPILGMALAALLLWLKPGRRSAVAAALVAVFGSLLLLSALGRTGWSYRERAAYRSALKRMDGSAGAALVLNPATYQMPIEQLLWFLNAREARLPVYGVYRGGAEAAQDDGERIRHLLGQHEELWLLTEGVGPGDPDSTTERALSGMAFLYGNEWLEDGFRLSRFGSKQPTARSGSPMLSLGDAVVLESWEIAWLGDERRSAQLLLRWRAITSLPGEHHLFAQALLPDGQVAASYDGVPGAGFLPASGWLPGDLIQERIALALPPGTDPAQLQFLVGMYDVTTRRRLSTPSGEDAIRLDAP